MSEIYIDIDNVDNDKICTEISDKIDNYNDVYNEIDVSPNKGKPITKIEVSPNEKYFVTYSQEDNLIVGWNVKDVEMGLLEQEFCFENIYDLKQMCVSDDKKLAYITGGYLLETYPKTKFKFNDKMMGFRYCTFNLKGELILLHKYYENATICIYSYSQNNWHCKRTYMIPKRYKDYTRLICVSKYDKLYLFSNNSIYEIDLITEKSRRIWIIDQEVKNRKFYEDIGEIKISSNEEFICTRFKNEIIIYSVELEIPVASFDINNDIQLREHPALCTQLFPLIFPLFGDISSNDFLDSFTKNYWKRCLESHLNPNDHLPEKFPDNIRATKKYALRVLDGDIWNIDFEELITKINLLPKNSDMVNEDNFKTNEKASKMYDYLHILLLNSYMETIRKLFQKANQEFVTQEFGDNLVKWRINFNYYTNYRVIALQVCKRENVDNEWDLVCIRYEKFKMDHDLKPLGIELFNESDIIILTNIGPLIYHFNEDAKSISLVYYYYIKIDIDISAQFTVQIQNCAKEFSRNNLPLPNYTSFEFCDGWISDVKNNKESLLKYGVELLQFAIINHKFELVDEIYKKCISHFKEDFKNKMFLNIITSTMPLLNEYYPEYISRYSLETTMIIDSSHYIIDYQTHNLHLFSFQYPQILVNIAKPILWIRYDLLMKLFYELYFKVVKYSSRHKIAKNTPMIIFMNPYIKFVNYPQEYKWYEELLFRPQSSPFVKTINRDIYKTWSGEALINFKWDTFGKYYYAFIWIGYMAFLGCFTVAATTPQQYIDENVRRKLLIASIILGFIHLSFEIRQMIYDVNKWTHDFWNIFDVIAYVLPILTSVRWLQTNEMNIIPLLSFSCLFLDIKSNFSLKEYTSNNDSNNPWNVVNTYQVFENGTLNPNPYIIQTPSENTNMFVDFRSSLFAMYKFLTGDSSALSNWSYVDNPSLAILIVLFSLLIVVYLMNLFIGLLNNAIEKDNDRVSYLVQKAEIIAEIELFYLLPPQRRWYKWFPDVTYYYADVDKTCEKVKEMIKKGEWDINDKLKKNLMNELKIQHNSHDHVVGNTLREILEEMYSQNSVYETTLRRVLEEMLSPSLTKKSSDT
ncbi:hypothetical protein RclHR1_06520001 [Rhizophagus clarus]|uniref:Ion transport domain-containing protein n=1 Tax=Rhizophagus clarus TaxID=94130 RepID=A0A2Z6S512_9GLOM|nr:hypothetical protein RclHR1_06520001 [Rhizophagus clarus]